MKSRVNHRQTIWMIAACICVLTVMLTSARNTQAQWQGTGNIYYNGGNVGIGTTSPNTLLELNSATPILTFNASTINSLVGLKWTGTGYGTTTLASSFFNGNSGEFRHEAGYSGYGGFHSFFTNGSERVRIDSSGRVGIGTTTPANKLSVTGVITSTGNADLPAAVGGQIDITGGYSSPDSGRLIFGDGSGWKMHLSKRSGSTTSDLVTFHDNGNVDVTGNINASGTINARYQDVAEWVPSSEQLTAGTVVVLDSTKSNQVISSSVSYDTRVAGVISAQPGIALGEKSDSKVLVATTGRVKVKVDASKGAIHIGDLLVTSDIPGVAMKSEPVEFAGRKMHMPGTLIGKALEPLEKGSGEILVLLSLQ